MADIVIRFPTQELADDFAGQMSDGFGEEFCDFRFHRLIAGKDGKKDEHWERVYTADGLPVYFVDALNYPME